MIWPAARISSSTSASLDDQLVTNRASARPGSSTWV